MPEETPKSSLRDTFESLVVTVILAVFGTTFVVQAFKIPSGSMEQTLLIGDHLLVNKFAFAWQYGLLRHLGPYRDLERQQVFVFKFPGTEVQAPEEPGEHFVKRVIGVPGDHIHIVHRQVFVNGNALAEPYAHYESADETRGGDDFPPTPEEINSEAPEWSDFSSKLTREWRAELPRHIENGDLVVPPGYYFAMGDNRENSWDSRFWGFVPRENVAGRPLLIYWSFETPTEEYQQTSFGDRIAQTADLVFHFFTKTRWRRTLRIVR